MALIAAHLNAGIILVVCGHCLVTLSITSYLNIKMALIAAQLNAGIILVVTM